MTLGHNLVMLCPTISLDHNERWKTMYDGMAEAINLGKIRFEPHEDKLTFEVTMILWLQPEFMARNTQIKKGYEIRVDDDGWEHKKKIQ